jgi:hypothetical protein
VLISRKAVFSSLVALVASAALLLAVSASGGEGSKNFESTLAGSLPTANGGPTIHNVVPGGVPWVIDQSEVRIKQDGEFDLEVRGLVIPSRGDPDGVTSVSASLFCGADGETTPAATTAAVPLSTAGDAKIAANLTLPATCFAPIVVVHPNGRVTTYIAISGWRS